MAKQYESWIIQLLDDFWDVFYPGVPRLGNATESKSRTIEKTIDKLISNSSLYNYFNEKGSPPTDGTKGLMGFFVLKSWKLKYPQKLSHLELNADEIRQKNSSDKYLMLYQQTRALLTKELTPKKEIQSSQKKDPTQWFSIDIWQNKKIKWIGFVGSLVICGLILWFFMHMPQGNQVLHESNFDNIVDDLRSISVLHVLTIALLLFFYFIQFGGNNYIKSLDDSKEKVVLLQFSKGWISLWIGWLLLYIWMSFKWSYEDNLQLQSLWEARASFSKFSWAIADLLSLISTISFFYLFFVMDVKTVRLKEDGEETPFINAMGTVLMISFSFLFLSVIDRFINFGVMDGALTLLYSMLTSISMLYFFARLDSHVFNVKRLLLAPLYLYAVIQVNWNNMKAPEFAVQGLLFFLVAFLLKIYLFFIVHGWLKNGDFQRYFREVKPKTKV